MSWKTGWITKKGVERLLGIDRSKVRRMQKAGELPFVRDERGVARFPRKEIEEMAQAKGRIIGVPPGPTAAKAFALFAQGKTWQEVMIALGQLNLAQPVEVVRKLHEQFLDQDQRPAHSERASVSKRKRAVRPDREDQEADVSNGDMVPDVDEWQREQVEVAKRAQAELDREQRAWEDAQRERVVAIERRRLPMPPSRRSEPAAVLDVFLAQLLARDPR